jgi:hypothetical protein
MYQDYYSQNYPYYGQQPPFFQQPQPVQNNREVSQFITINSENEIGSRLMPRDGTPVFYRVKDTQNVFECAFIGGQTCITAYSLVPKIQKQEQQQQQQNNNIPNNNSSFDELNRRLTHVEKYLQDLTSGGSNNASVYPSNPATATATEPVRTVTPAAIS